MTTRTRTTISVSQMVVNVHVEENVLLNVRFQLYYATGRTELGLFCMFPPSTIAKHYLLKLDKKTRAGLPLKRHCG